MVRPAIAGPVLVTGAAGFVAGHLIRRLIERNLRVRALIRPGTTGSDLTGLDVDLVVGDVTDPTSVHEAIRGCLTVFHLAASRGPAKLARKAYLRANRLGAATVGEAAIVAGVERLVFTSTASLLRPGNAPGTERSPVRPTTGYRESKLLAETTLRRLGEEAGLPVVIARLPSILGPGARDWQRRFRAVAERRVHYLPSGGMVHLGDIEDMVTGLGLCATTPGIEGQIFILASAQPVRVRELYEEIARSIGVTFKARELPGPPFRAYARMAEVAFHWTGRALPYGYSCERLACRERLDITKARTVLGFVPQWDLAGSVRRTADWLRATGLLVQAGKRQP